MPILFPHLPLFDPLLGSPVLAVPFCLVVTISVKMVSFRHVRYFVDSLRAKRKKMVSFRHVRYFDYSLRAKRKKMVSFRHVRYFDDSLSAKRKKNDVVSAYALF